MTLPVYNCLINEDLEDESGIYAISFVNEPANETSFITLNKQLHQEYLNLDRKKQILTGVVLRPEQLIYRNSAQMGEHYIKFSKEQIEKISHKMMRNSLALHNTTHQHQEPLEGNYLIELWIVEDPRNDKSNALGFKDLPKGTLMCSYKIEDKKYWENEVLAGNVKGFSLEGFFFQQEMKRHTKSKINKQTNMNRKNKSTLLNKIGRFFLDIEAVQSNDNAQSGVAYVTFTLADGKEAKVDEDGFATLEGEQIPAGEHPLADGNILVIDEQGQFLETKQTSAQNKQTDEATAPQVLNRRVRRKLVSMADEDNLNPQTETTPDIVDLAQRVADLETLIQDLQAQIDQIASDGTDAKAEVENLRKITPGTSPLTQAHHNRRNYQDATYTERMAASLSLQIQRKK